MAGIIALTYEAVRDKATPVTTARAQARRPKSDTCTESLLALLFRCPELVARAFVALSVLFAPPSSFGSLETDYLRSFVSISWLTKKVEAFRVISGRISCSTSVKGKTN